MMKVSKWAITKRDVNVQLYFKRFGETSYGPVPIWGIDKYDCKLFKAREFAEEFAQGHFWKDMNNDDITIIEIKTEDIKDEQH